MRYQKRMKIKDVVVIYNQPQDDSSSAGAEAADDTVLCAKQIYTVLTEAGIKVRLFKLTEASVSLLKKIKTDCFFNLAWGIGSDEESESKVCDLLEKTGIPYTGSGAEALRITSNKIKVKKILSENKISTPGFVEYSGGRVGRIWDELKFPLIVKPSEEDCSIGIGAKSVFNNSRGLATKIKDVYEEFGGQVLLEEFIDGRELNVAILDDGGGPKVLPISEIVFGKHFSNKPKVVDYDAKWVKDSDSYRDTKGVCPARLEKKLENKIKKLALEAFLACGCRNYARVDFRLSTSGAPYVLEVNANPAIGPGDGLARSAKASGMDYSSLLLSVLHGAVLLS